MKWPHQAVVALSGGVDSAVVGALLKQAGVQVQAVYMRNWDTALNGDVLGQKPLATGCHDQNDLLAVQEICQQLKIPLKIYNFVPQYWEEVFDPWLKQLTTGVTPNPDVWCNQKIKFGQLLAKINLDFGQDITIATGHYANIKKIGEQYYLMTAQNQAKDQTYFLNQLTQQQLARIIFPLGEMKNKDQVRQLAKQIGLKVWNKPDSMGICFIGKRHYQQFLSNYLPPKPGPIINVVDKTPVGQHNGLYFYTWNQRKGLNLSGQKEPMVVCGKNLAQNTLLVCPKSLLFNYLATNKTIVTNPHWINQLSWTIGQQLYLRFRHTGQLLLATIAKIHQNLVVFHHQKQITTAPGQYVVFYDLNKRVCLGGGVLVISEEKNYVEINKSRITN